MNIIEAYMKFKNDFILELFDILNPKYLDKKYLEYKNKLIDTYFETYYFHILQTLDLEDIKDYNYKTIKEEINGMIIELTYDHEEDKKEIEEIAKYLLILIRIIHKDCDLESLTEFLEKSHVKADANKILKEINTHKTKETKFLNSLELDDFYLKKYAFKNETDKYKLTLKQDIKQLKKNYTDISINKNYKGEKFTLSRIKILLNLLNGIIIKEVIESNELPLYFIDIEESLYNEELLNEIFNLTNYPYIKEKVIFTLDLNSYLKNKKLFNKYNYSFAINVDMSHINDVEAKLENVEALDKFNYIVVSKIKDKDIEKVMNYSSIKQIIIES